MIVLAILGTVLTRLLVDDSKFVSRQDAMMSARQAARAAMNTMVHELRMVSDGGLVAASNDSVRFRMPYVFGMACQQAGIDVIASLTPPDSLMYANATPSGMARRNGSSGYIFAAGVGVAPSGNQAACDADSIRVIPGGSLVAISGLAGPQIPAPGTLIYLYQTVSYKFDNSVDLPGRIGLWRREGTAAYEELVAPFDSAAGFQCLTGPGLLVETCPPAGGIPAVRGIELRLVGASEQTPRGEDGPQTFAVATQVTFLNKVN